MRTLFARANPVSDASSVELKTIEAAAYLATLEQRSSEMTQLDTAPVNAGTKKRKMTAAVAGGLAVAAIAVVGLIAAQSGSEPDFGSADAYTGIWVSVDGVYIEFNDDLTYTAAWTLEEVSAGTFEKGTWSYDGTEFVWIATEGNCPAGEQGRYTLEPADRDTVRWNVVWDVCTDRLTDLGKGPMERISS